MERKINFNFPLGIDEGKQVKRAQVEFSETYGVREFYGRALVRGAAELLKERGGPGGLVAVDEAAFIEKVKAEQRAKKAAAERERRRRKKNA